VIHKLVSGVQILAVLCAAAFVVMLFANEPDSVDSGPPPADESAADDPVIEADGAGVFSERCASCHGSDGGGSVGPQLSDGRVVERFPDVADQIEVVRDGRGAMPSFEDRLSEAEIEAVVEYTRTL
jgi:mono/diheme cytochrome c family protein